MKSQRNIYKFSSLLLFGDICRATNFQNTDRSVHLWATVLEEHESPPQYFWPCCGAAVLPWYGACWLALRTGRAYLRSGVTIITYIHIQTYVRTYGTVRHYIPRLAYWRAVAIKSLNTIKLKRNDIFEFHYFHQKLDRQVCRYREMVSSTRRLNRDQIKELAMQVEQWWGLCM